MLKFYVEIESVNVTCKIKSGTIVFMIQIFYYLDLTLYLTEYAKMYS